ncbi:MAG TPA: oligopeptide/dipeptide ABC transporter ATP-binding protein [Planctomycetota bacterium]|nr:oligopeptide/dipeptide ABC transporter ATP-binding protein [Planctomycetota bacterium]
MAFAHAADTPTSAPLLQVQNLTKHFPIKRGLLNRTVGHVQAVTNVSFNVRRGETLGLVGESGCGKTTIGRSILRLIEPTAGRVIYDGEEIQDLPQSALRPYRKRMQIIFQDPYSSLNPRMTVEQIIAEGLIVHEPELSALDRREKVYGLLKSVGLAPQAIERYPHEFSGGQRQRIGIARALAVNPEFIVCDEAVSALDVSVQAQIINLLMDLQKERNISYLFIAHDLSVVEHISQRVAVMYLGNIVETADTRELFANAKHPYTRFLLDSVPKRTPDDAHNRAKLQGEPPSPINPPPGCPFAPRCPLVMPACNDALPPQDPMGAPGHLVRCPVVRDKEKAMAK